MNQCRGGLKYVFLVAVLFLAASAPGCLAADPPATKASPPKKEEALKTISLFDGKSLQGWKLTEFGGRGEVRVEKGEIRFDMGVALTGLTYTNTNSLPKVNYEITLEGQKVAGNDFFCGLTAPYKDSHFTLVLGGWGGAVVGISSVEGSDASDNETTKYLYLEKGKWFKVRLRVTDDRIAAWVDEEQVVDLDTRDKKITMRPGEIELNIPLGLAAWQTSSAFRNIQLKKL